MNPIVGFIGGFFISALVMTSTFQTNYWRAFGATVIAWVLQIVIFGGIALAFLLAVGGLAALA